MPIFYTYRSFEEFDGGRSYIGYRKCPAGETPETDPYLGSYTDKSFTPTAKEILGIYHSREEAMQAEINLHKKFDVARNPHFANKSCATSSGFYIAKHSEKTRRKLSEAKRGKNNPMFGKSPSEDTRRKLSEANIGKTLSLETRRKLSEVNIGKTFSLETKRKMSKAHKGKALSRETKRKMSEAKRGKNNPQYGKGLPRDWHHPDHGVVLQTSLPELVRLFPDQRLHKSCLECVALGRRHQHKGWSLYANIEPSKIRNGTQGTMAERTT